MELLSSLAEKIITSGMPSVVRRPLAWLRQKYREKVTQKIAAQQAKRTRHCNICGWRGERFLTRRNEMLRCDEEIACPVCLSEPRQRALFKYLRQRFFTEYVYIIKERNFLCLEIGPDRSRPVKKPCRESSIFPETWTERGRCLRSI
ncbi:MAG: hypothetical protein PHR56_06985 [Dehalococcoidales bacterium]|nr:hypothetical protein [Dehalococcoidales bacterium]